ncbi:MAG: sugar ABC transporter permease [Bacilli bacterium]|nr:sugar ABC transporter permease [Bacilli bacterium]
METNANTQVIEAPNNKAPKKKKHLSRKASSAIFVAVMLLLPLVQFAIFWILPNFNSILLAFQKRNSTEFTFLQFETFWRDLTDVTSRDHTLLISSIVNSLIFFAVNIFVCTPIVLFFSYVLFRKVPAHGVFKVIFYLPSILGLTVTATMFLFVFKPGIGNSLGGPMWELFKTFGWIPKDVIDSGKGLFGHTETGFIMVIAYSIWTCVGLNMIMFHGAMKRIPNEVFESAELDGVGFFRQFFNIVVPLIWPTISTLIIFSLSGIFVSYGAVMILTPNNSESSMIGWFILQKTTSPYGKDPNYAAAVGVVFTCIGLPFILLIKKLLDKIGSNVEY